MREVYSQRYRMWKAQIDLKTCVDCKARHGKIYKTVKKKKKNRLYMTDADAILYLSKQNMPEPQHIKGCRERIFG